MSLLLAEVTVLVTYWGVSAVTVAELGWATGLPTPLYWIHQASEPLQNNDVLYAPYQMVSTWINQTEL